MVIKRILCAALLVAGLMSSADVSAQNSQNTTRWTGSDITSLDPDGTGQLGEEVFLYNVGTGRFMIHGGDWGIQGRLFYNDSGKMLTFFNAGGSNYYFDSGMVTDKQDGIAKYMICNVPDVCCARDRGWESDEATATTDGTKTYTIIFDGNQTYGGRTIRNWKFTRVNSNDGTFTYYMHQELDGNNYWLGAAYGENHGNHDGDPNGKMVRLSSSYDKATWTTQAPGNFKVDYVDEGAIPSGLQGVIKNGDTEVPIFNVDTKVSLDDLYKWRVVKKSDLLASMTSSDIGDGLSTNLTYLINDRGFERNDFSFFNTETGWVAKRFTDDIYTTSGEGRYRFTWGYLEADGANSLRRNNQGYGQVRNGNNTTNIYFTSDAARTFRNVANENYMVPVRLKAQFDAKYRTYYNGGTTTLMDQFDGKADAKYGYLEFEGVGTVSTYIVAPEDGVYRIAAYGFCQGPNDAYFFATTTDPSQLSIADISNSNKVKLSTALKSVSNFDKSDMGDPKPTSATKDVIGAGYDFVWNKTDYRRELEISVNKNDNIYFGIVKSAATKSGADVTSGGTSYFHDTDWVGADQFEIIYLGSEDAKLFDEDKTGKFADDTYLGTSTYTNRAIRLHRKFQKNKWNSFVFPMDLTAVQVRTAFGDDARVAELKGIGVADLSNNADIIDFASVPLGSENLAIKAGKMYLVMPTQDPSPGIPSTYNKDYYTLGSASFNGTALDGVTMDPTTYSPAAGSKNADGHNNIKIDGTFFSSLEYEDTSAGNQNPKINGPYVPSGSYVMGLKDGVYAMYYTQRDLKTKGFRAWVVDLDAQDAKSFKIAFNGVSDETDGIENIFEDATVVVPQNSSIFDLSGRKVAANANQLNTLPKGMYIVNGKKYVVK